MGEQQHQEKNWIKKGTIRELKGKMHRLQDSIMTQLRKLKKDIRTAKGNFKARIASDVQKDPKRFYQLYKAKAEDRIGPLK